MKHIQVEETWIDSNSYIDSATDKDYYAPWEHLADSYEIGCITIYIKTIVA